MPASPYIHLLNRPDLTSDADLAVVAGDIQGQGILGRLAVFATDLFFREDHDLVVDTDSMDEGPARQQACLLFVPTRPGYQPPCLLQQRREPAAYCGLADAQGPGGCAWF